MGTESMSTSNNGSGNTRVTGTSSRVTTSTTNDTYQVVGTLVADSAKTITEFGLFDTIGTAVDLVTAPSGGGMFVHSSFTGVALSTSDSIAFTAKVAFS